MFVRVRNATRTSDEFRIRYTCAFDKRKKKKEKIQINRRNVAEIYHRKISHVSSRKLIFNLVVAIKKKRCIEQRRSHRRSKVETTWNAE